MKISSFPGRNWHSEWDDKSVRRALLVRLDRFGCWSSQLRDGGVSVFTWCVRLFLRIYISGSSGRNRGKHWSWIRKWDSLARSKWRGVKTRSEETTTDKSLCSYTLNGQNAQKSIMFVCNNQWRRERTKHKVQESEFTFPPTKCREKTFLKKIRSKVRMIVTYPQIVILLIGSKWPHDADILPTVFA